MTTRDLFLRDAGIAMSIRDTKAQALLPDLRIVEKDAWRSRHGITVITTAGQPDDGQFRFYPWCAARCGAYVDDGPFRYCVKCRQVDFFTLRNGGH